MVENIKQTILIPAAGLISDAWRNEKTLAALDVVNAASQENLEQARKDFFENLSVENKVRFKSVGIEVPTDLIKLSLTLGSFVYDILVPSIPKPTAPLRLAAYKKHLGDLAQQLLQPEFTLTAEELESLRTVLDDDALWLKVRVEADVGDSNLSLPLTQEGLTAFDQVIQAAINLFEPEKTAEKVEEKIEKVLEEEEVLPVEKKKRGRKPKAK